MKQTASEPDENGILPFPRPGGPERILLLEDESAGPSREEIHALLTHPEARDVLPTDHPHSIRGLLSGGWFFKTRPDQCHESLDTLMAVLARKNAETRRIGVWPREKRWFLLEEGPCYWICNVAPYVETVSEMRGWRKLVYLATISLIVWSKRMTHGITLDPWPRNFGVKPGESRLYYIDDETYPREKGPEEAAQTNVL